MNWDRLRVDPHYLAASGLARLPAMFAFSTQ
jgi:hypothetical protein